MNSIPSTRTPVRFIIINEQQALQRIDNFLLRELKNLPKSHLYRLLRKGEIRVNKSRTAPLYRLKLGDSIRLPPLLLKAPTIASLHVTIGLKQLMKKSVLYEDSNLLIINKPPGMAAHGGSGIVFGLVETLRNLHPNLPYLELAHRLDRETSGCIILTKKPKVLREIHELIRNHQIEKDYLLMVVGLWPKGQKVVNQPLQKNFLHSGERFVQVHPEGKAALTHFKVLSYYQINQMSFSLLQATLITGRMHQIRVHAKHVGHPILMDGKYGSKTTNQLVKKLFCPRLFLHASRLRFALPSQADHLFEIKAPLPADLQKFMQSLSVLHLPK